MMQFRRNRSPFPGVRGALIATCAAALVILGSAAGGLAEEQQGNQAARDYARAIAGAQAALDGGRVAEARQHLEATDGSLRSFEYDYLLARAAAPGDDAAAPDLIRTIALPPVDTRYGVLNETDRQLVFLCRDGSLRIHDLAAPDAAPRTVSHAPGGAIWSGAFSKDGKTFIAGHQNGDVVIWDSATWKARHTLSRGSEWPVRELAVGPDGTSFVVENKQELELWSLAEGGPAKVAGVGQRYNFGEGLAFSPRGDLVATGGMFDIVLYDARTGAEVRSIRHASYTMGLEFSPDGQRIASAPRGNVNKFLSVFEIAGGQPVFTAGPLANYIVGLAFTPDGKRVVATGPEQDVRLFDAASGVVMFSLKRPGRTAKPAVSRDGRLLGWFEADGYRYLELGRPPDAAARG